MHTTPAAATNMNVEAEEYAYIPQSDTNLLGFSSVSMPETTQGSLTSATFRHYLVDRETERVRWARA